MSGYLVPDTLAIDPGTAEAAAAVNWCTCSEQGLEPGAEGHDDFSTTTPYVSAHIVAAKTQAQQMRTMHTVVQGNRVKENDDVWSNEASIGESLPAWKQMLFHCFSDIRVLGFICSSCHKAELSRRNPSLGRNGGRRRTIWVTFTQGKTGVRISCVSLSLVCGSSH
jgi:hypothetical protein